MSKSFRRLCSALTKEQTQSLENVQRWALQIIFCNSPCGLSFGTLQRSSLCDGRRELCESSFRQIVLDESHVLGLHYLLPAKRVTHFLLTDCKQQRHFHYSTRGQGLKNPFLCPDGRVATGEGRLAQWGRTKFVLHHWASRPTKLAAKQALIFTVITYNSICML